MPNTIEITVRVKDQASAEVGAIAEKIRAEMKSAKGGGDEGIKVPVEPDTTGFEEEVKTKTRRTKPDPIKVPVELPKEDFEAEFRKAMEEGEQVSQKASAEMRRSFTSVESGSRSLRAAMADLEPATSGAGRGLEDVGRKAEGAGGSAERSGSGFSLAANRMALMVTGAMALAPALAALPAIGGAVVVGAATMTLGFGGVIKALKDYGAQSESAGQTGAQLAAQEFANAVAIKNAQQAIADAKKQQARGAADAAEQVKNAEQGVADAERSAATATQSSADQIASAQRSVESSAYNLAQAEQRLQDAQKSALDAQKALTQAREDAANQLKDLNNSSADSHLAVERATLNVSKAQENLAKVIGSSLSTDDQKKDAQLSLAEAQQALIDAKQRDVEATQKSDAANKSGVDGMQQVVQAQDAVAKASRGVQDAQHGVADATQAQADAQKALARAVQAAADQQISSTEAVAKAQQALADAQRSADRQRQDSAESVSKAEQNLADTYKQQQLSAAAAASAGGGAANKFAQDMAALTPQAQAFVKQLLSMKDGAHQLSVTAQTAMMPGLTQMLKDSGPLLPIFNGAVRDMGGIVGNVAQNFGKLMQSPAFQGALVQVLKDGAGFAKDLGDGLVGMVNGVMQAASQAGPIVDGLGQGIKTLMTSGIPDFFSGLAQNASGIGQAFQGVLTFVSNLAGPLGTVSGALATALAPAIQVLASPSVKQALDSIGTSIAQILIVLSPVITMIAQGLAGALKIAAPLLSSVAKFLQDNHTWLVPLAKIITGVAIAWWGLNAAMAANPLLLIAGLIAGLVTGLIYAWEHFSGFRDFVKQMWADIKGAFLAFLHFVEHWWPELLAPFTLGTSEIVGHWNSVVDFVKKLPGKLASAAAGIWDWVSNTFHLDWFGKKWDDLTKSIKDLPGKLATAGAGLWDWIWDAFKKVLNSLANAWNSIKFTMPSLDLGPLGTIGGWTIGVPPLPTFKAAGGPIAGGLSAVIGDRGTELITLPNGTQIMPHANTQSALAQGGAAGAPMRLELDWAPGAGGGDELLTWLRSAIRVKAGGGKNSVQVALGQTF